MKIKIFNPQVCALQPKLADWERSMAVKMEEKAAWDKGRFEKGFADKVTWYHADDYGVSLEQCERILSCYQNGVLNSVSILPNVPDLDGALGLLEQADKKHVLRRVLHLNFVEGKPLAGAKEVSLLVDKEGYFDKSFIQYFIWNYTAAGKQRVNLKKQLCAEIRAQLRAVAVKRDFHITAVDSHQHYHMIPIVFDCLMAVLGEAEFAHVTIRQVRIPVDPLKPAFTVKKPKRIPAVNLVKWLILKTASKRNRKILLQKGIEVPAFFGILYTCEMRWEIVRALFPSYKKYANAKETSLELMFHPGNLTADYELLDRRRGELREFYLSDNRFFEAECLKMLKNQCASRAY